MALDLFVWTGLELKNFLFVPNYNQRTFCLNPIMNRELSVWTWLQTENFVWTLLQSENLLSGLDYGPRTFFWNLWTFCLDLTTDLLYWSQLWTENFLSKPDYRLRTLCLNLTIDENFLSEPDYSLRTSCLVLALWPKNFILESVNFLPESDNFLSEPDYSPRTFGLTWTTGR